MKRAAELEVVEGIAGMWHYHLRHVGELATVCGDRNVMSTRLPLTSWGRKSTHIPESYCEECETGAKAQRLM